MPIYEYRCESCGHQFEKMVKIGAETPPCPACEAANVRKMVSAPSFHLKGSGWYKDHYGLKSSSDSGSKSEAAAAPAPAPAAPKSDT